MVSVHLLYENESYAHIFPMVDLDETNDIEHCQIKVKVTLGLQKFSPFTTIQTVRSYNSTLVPATKLILSLFVHLILI